MSNRLAAALVIIVGIVVMVLSLILAITLPDLAWWEFCLLGLMFIIGLGAAAGGSEML